MDYSFLCQTGSEYPSAPGLLGVERKVRQNWRTVAPELDADVYLILRLPLEPLGAHLVSKTLTRYCKLLVERVP